MSVATPRTRTAVYMDTGVSLVVIPADDAIDVTGSTERAFGWFRCVEDVCTRFEEQSEVMQLARRVGEPVPVSPVLFQVVQIALAVARVSRGAFDPTVGHALETRGYNRNYRTGRTVTTELPAGPPVTYRDVRLDPARQTITLKRPLILDLGAVAKGFAIDLAARELAAYPGFLIDAGGDLYAGGLNASGEPWRVGIRHPRQPDALIDVIRVTDCAVCTSGDYERPATNGGTGHHILDPRSGSSPGEIASVTAVAPTAAVADALGTAAFVLGLARGIEFLQRQGADGMIVTDRLERHETTGFARLRP
jgi:thiamine biosynthesis lipoprotein